MDKQTYQPALEWSDGLAMAARDHCLDAGSNGLTGTLGSDYSTHFDRIYRYGEPGWHVAQNMAFGARKAGDDVVMRLLTNNKRSHKTSRQIIFDNRWTLAGVSSCEHSTHTFMTTIVYAKKFRLHEEGKAKLA